MNFTKEFLTSYLFFLWLTYAWVVCANIQFMTNFRWFVLSLMYLSQLLFGNSILSTLVDDLDQRRHSYLTQIVLWTVFFFPVDLIPLVRKENQKAFCFNCSLILSLSEGRNINCVKKNTKWHKNEQQSCCIMYFSQAFFSSVGCRRVNMGCVARVGWVGLQAQVIVYCSPTPHTPLGSTFYLLLDLPCRLEDLIKLGGHGL